MMFRKGEGLRAAFAAALVTATTLCSVLHADNASIPCSRDNILIESLTGQWSAGLNFGIVAGQTNQPTGERLRRAVMYFDPVGVVPLGSTISAASVRLKMTKSTLAGTNTFTLHRILADWGEGTSRGSGGAGSLTTPGSATWIHRFSPNQFWSANGGDFVASPSASLSVAGLGYYTWSSAQLASEAQGWLNDPASNFGWMLRGNETSASPTAKRFDSEEATVVSDRPTLLVTFTPPAVVGACCLGTRCVQGSSAACVAVGGVYQGDNSVCESQTCAPPCPADIYDDGVVNTDDLILLIGSWGACPRPCPADIDGNGTVNTDDLLVLIGSWGPCP